MRTSGERTGLFAKTAVQAVAWAAALAVCVSLIFASLSTSLQMQASVVSYVIIWIAIAVWTFAVFGVKKALTKSK